MGDTGALVRWSHEEHDPYVIAAALGGSTLPRTVAACPACGALHRDLLSIQTALRHAWTPRRPRDLRLTALHVARLRPALWRRLLGAIGSSRDAITRPLAAGLTTLGIAGVVLSNTGAGFGAAAGATPAEVTVHSTGGPTTQPMDVREVDGTAPVDPILLISSASLVAGGGLFVVRRMARRTRGVR